ncbi:hypothetical protein Ae406Ps2_6378 [Pseudonocardia sp. Ae406_Ps2]|nr:hypothetical protein Ae331Ps2_5998c [Pseudonocardia sp. Ae331_Ps2]OLL89899.1 hypothetical protein Ae406Ps2_6378 [Pseudonocardia sp. Ae406_Ps2]OLM09332.1 hypothetical protein Ae706Ps2_6525c [Pseudonocardia sp. Ae706_Ps2]OLM09341.1 hypothetical protein Ae706Ps2_6534c [Pseudonocardia sp. Ae706_Ps2]
MLPWLYDDRYRRRSPDYDRRHPAADPLLLDGMPLRLPDRGHLRLHTSDLTSTGGHTE